MSTITTIRLEDHGPIDELLHQLSTLGVRLYQLRLRDDARLMFECAAALCREPRSNLIADAIRHSKDAAEYAQQRINAEEERP